MKHGKGSILHPEQEEYLERLLPPRDPILREMEEIGEREEIPISDPEVGKLLAVLVRATGARRILEVGTAIGYSALCMARGAPEARLLSIDKDPERLAQAVGAAARDVEVRTTMKNAATGFFEAQANPAGLAPPDLAESAGPDGCEFYYVSLGEFGSFDPNVVAPPE